MASRVTEDPCVLVSWRNSHSRLSGASACFRNEMRVDETLSVWILFRLSGYSEVFNKASEEGMRRRRGWLPRFLTTNAFRGGNLSCRHDHKFSVNPQFSKVKLVSIVQSIVLYNVITCRVTFSISRVSSFNLRVGFRSLEEAAELALPVSCSAPRLSEL